MAYVTIEKDGESWMLCHATRAGDIERQIAACRTDAPNASFAQRPSTTEESQRCADTIEARHETVEDPFRFFAIHTRDIAP